MRKAGEHPAFFEDVSERGDRVATLDKRLSSVASFVRQGARLADIGTDHAYLPVELVKSGVCKSALACDLRKGPLENAKAHVESAGLAEKIECRLGDGLSPVKAGEADDFVLAGMGGETIAAILSACPFIRNEQLRVIAQPMTHPEDLRRFLWNNGFVIRAETAVTEDDKAYLVLCAEYTGENTPATDADCFVGNVAPSEAAKRYQEKRLFAAEKRLAGLETAGGAAAELDTLREIVSRLKEEIG